MMKKALLGIYICICLFFSAKTIWGMDSVWFGGRDSAISSTTTMYNALVGGRGWNSASTNSWIGVGANGTLKNFYVELASAPGDGKSYTFTIYKNGADTNVTTTISNLNTSNSDIVNAVGIVMNDRLNIKSTPTNSPTAGLAYWSVLFNTTTSNVSNLGSGATDSSSGYIVALGHAVNSEAAEVGAQQLITVPGNITTLSVGLDAAPGSGNSYTFTLRINATNTSLATTISNTDTSNTATGDVTVIAGNLLDTIKDMYVGMQLNSVTAGESAIMGVTETDTNNTNVRYQNLIAPNTEVTESDAYTLGQSCTLKNFYVQLATAPDAGKSYLFTNRVEATNTTVAVTISGTDTAGSDTSNTATVNNGNVANTMITPSGTPAVSTEWHWGYTCFISTAPPPSARKRTILIQLNI